MIIATADNHIGYRQYGLKSREEDIQNSLKAIIDAAINSSSDLTISGDLIHTTRPTPASIAFLKECHLRMMSHGMAAYVISGNHDKSSPHWIENFCDSDSGDTGFQLIDNLRVKAKNSDIYIRGVPFTNLTDWKDTITDINSDEPVDLVLMHQSFNEFTNFENPEGFSGAVLNDLDPHKCKAIVVGDTHVSASFMTHHGINVMSPGSTETISMSEDSEKTVILIRRSSSQHEDDDGLVFNDIPVPTRPCYSFDISDEKELDFVIECLTPDMDKGPIVNIKCNYAVDSGLSRLNQLFVGEAILRFRHYNPKVEEAIDTENELNIQEVLSKFINAEDAEYELATILTNPECDARYEIDSYIDKRLDELQDSELHTG